ncbi:MAG: alpha/beta fold hydrolase [Blastocatellia bacterium]|nr:alpha/beta fold hydrolase [Blastocatellia bacterium]
MLTQLSELLLTLLRDEAARGVLRTVNGARLLTGQPLVVPERAPFRLVTEQRMYKLRRYLSRRRNSRRTPVLLVPPLMVQPEILDLRPEVSLVRTLLAHHYDVFLVDFGSPKRRDRDFKLDDYVTKRVRRAVRKIRQVTGQREVSVIGYCMGGIFANLLAARYPEEGVRNVISIGAPTDFSTLPGYQALAQVVEQPLMALAEKYGQIPAGVCRTVFNLCQPVKLVTRPLRLLWNLWDTEYVARHQVMSRWVEDFVPLTAGVCRQFFHELLCENRLYEGTFQLNGETVDLGRIQASYLALAGDQDHLIAPACVESVLDRLTVADATFELVPGGHLGVLVGTGSDRLRETVVDWLHERSVVARPARRARRAHTQPQAVTGRKATHSQAPPGRLRSPAKENDGANPIKV